MKESIQSNKLPTTIRINERYVGYAPINIEISIDTPKVDNKIAAMERGE